MKTKELLEMCSAAISGSRDVQLVIPRRATGERITLAGRGSPLGEICCENNDGNTVAWFSPTEVLIWLTKIGAIRPVKTKGLTMTFEVMEG